MMGGNFFPAALGELWTKKFRWPADPLSVGRHPSCFATLPPILSLDCPIVVSLLSPLDFRRIAAGSGGSNQSPRVFLASPEGWRVSGWLSVLRKLRFCCRSGFWLWLNLGQVQPEDIAGFEACSCRFASGLVVSLPPLLSSVRLLR
ncbi:hypothetical protein YC2023_039066 [Brassica napus]